MDTYFVLYGWEDENFVISFEERIESALDLQAAGHTLYGILESRVSELGKNANELLEEIKKEL